MDASLLLRDYNEFRAQTKHVGELKSKGRYIKGLQPTPSNLRALDHMVHWCESKNVEPRHWLYSLFVARFWRYAPKLNQLCSEKHLLRYAEINTRGGHRQIVERAETPLFDPNIDISMAAELLKLRFLRFGNPGRCFERSLTETLGYHPKSEYCQVCPLATACEAQLQARAGFDITALRRGEITRDQAMTLAAHHASR